MLSGFFAKNKLFFAFFLALILVIAMPLTVSAATDEGDSNAPCPAYSFTTMDGSTITNEDNAGKTTLMIFFNKADGNSASNISELAASDWITNENLSILALEFNGASASDLQTYAQNYGNGGKDITFCSTSTSVLWYFLNAAGYGQNSTAIPVSFIVDTEGNIRHYMTGRVSEQSYREALVGYVEGLTLPPKATVSITGTYDYSEAFDVLELVNAQRAANGCDPLTMNSTLLEAAMKRAAECSVYFSHTRPNGSACSTIVSFSYFGENIAAGYANAADAMDGWMNSSGHRANILNTQYDSIGIGVFYQDGVAYWVQLFSKNCGTATATETADQQRTVTFDVLDSNLSMSVSPATVELEKGGSEELAVYIQNTQFYNYRVKLDPSCLTYTSDNTAVAKTGIDGTVTGVGGGTATVTAVPNGSTKSVSVSVSVTAPLLDTPSITSVASVTAGVKVSWGAVSGAESYEVLVNDGSGWTSAGTTTATTLTYTAAESGKSYTFSVRCVDAAGEAASDYDATGKTITYLSTPKITSLANTASGVKITWGKVTGAEKYGVYVRTAGTSWKGIGTSTGNTFTYTKAASGTKYYFTVRCLDPDNNAGVSSFHATGWSATYIAQPKVTSLSNTASGIKVTWGKVTGAEKYRVYVKTAGGSWTNIGTTTSNTLTYTGAKSGTKYYFTVRCLNATATAFTSSFHPTGWSATYVAQPKITSLSNTASGIKVTWGKVTGAAKYRLYVKTEGGSWTNIGTTTSNTLTYTGAKSGTKYYFTVRCLNATATAFTSSFHPTGWSATYIAQPEITNLESTASGVKITWGSVPGAEKYRVYVKGASGWQFIGLTDGNTFTYTKAVVGESYTFTVRCVNAANNAFTSSNSTTGWTTTYNY